MSSFKPIHKESLPLLNKEKEFWATSQQDYDFSDEERTEGNDDELNLNSKESRKGIKVQGRWTREEHKRFVDGIYVFLLVALKIHGRDWKKVESYVATRSGA
jgi:hypothetical protein